MTRYVVLAVALLLMFLALLSLADALWVISPAVRFILVGISVLSLLSWSAYQTVQLRQKTNRYLRKFFTKFPDWLKYPPEEIEDVSAGRLITSQPWSLVERQQFFREHDRGIDSLPRGSLRREMLSPGDYMIWVLTALALMLCAVFLISPFRALRTTQTTVPASYYSLTPPPGKYFFAQPLEIIVSEIHEQYTFVGFEFETTDQDWQRVDTSPPMLRTSALSQPLKVRLAFRRGIEKLYSEPLLYDTVEPGSFKSIRFHIKPPSFTGQQPWSSEDYTIKLPYGSQVTAEIRHTPSNRVWYGNVMLVSVAGIASHRFVFASPTQLEISYRLRDDTNNSELLSPVYSFQTADDALPLAHIYLPQPELRELRLPAKGKITFHYSIEDDLGFREASVVVRDTRNQVVAHRLKPNLQVKEGRIFGQGSASVDLTQMTGNRFFLQVAVRDNSLIPGKFPWEQQPSPGQTAVSQTIEIRIAVDEDQAAFFETEQMTNLMERMSEIAKLYRDSEKTLMELARRARNGEDVLQELKHWAAERNQLQQAIDKLQDSIEKQSSRQASPEESARKEEALRLSQKLLEENIAQREKELQQLLQNFPTDFEQATTEMKKISREEYLAGLEKSIQDLKIMLELKKLRELEQKISREIQELNRLSREHLENDNATKTQQDIQSHYQRVDSLKAEAQKSPRAAMPSEAEKRHDKARRNYAQSPETAGKINALKDMRSALADWRDEIRQERSRLGAAEYDRISARLKIAALRVNSVAEVWEMRRSQIGEMRGPEAAEKIRRLGQDAAALRTSFRAELASLSADLGSTSMLAPELSKNAAETDAVFDQLLQTVEKGQQSLFLDRASHLRWRLNRFSLELMKEMEKMKMQAATTAGAGAGEQLSEGAGEQQALREELQKLGDGQSNKDGSLSPGEQAYLESLAARQEDLARRLGQALNQKKLLGKDQAIAMQELVNELKQNSEELKEVRQAKDLQRQIEKTDQLKEKFLSANKSTKQRDEKKPEREAERAREYRIEAPLLPPDKEKIPARKMPVYDDSLNEAQRQFYLRFLQNLEQAR